MMNEAPSGVPAGEIAFTQHRGLVSRQQQDALLVGGDLHQSPNLAGRLLGIGGPRGLRALAGGEHQHFAVAKAFHVSPFLPRDLEYRMSFSPPGQRLGVRAQ